MHMLFLWRIIITFNTSTDLLVKTFLAFFIWESEQNLYPILLLGLAYFIARPVASLISGIISDKLNSKIPLVLGTLIQIAQLLVIIEHSNLLTLETIAIIGAMGGFADGLKGISIHTIDLALRKIHHKDDANKFYSMRTFISHMLELILPLSAAFVLAQTGNYIDLFKISIILISVQTLITLIFKSPTQHNSFDLKSVFSIPGTNKDKPALIQGVFFEGLEEGVTLTILPVIVLIFAGSILNWGLLNTSFVLVGVLLSFIFSRIINDANAKIIYAFGALIFAASSILFLNDISLAIILIFMFTKTLMGIIKETSYHASLDKIIEEDSKQQRLHAEYKFLIEFFSSIGSVIPILALMYLKTDIHNDLVLRITLLAVGLLPITVLSILGKTAIFKNDFGQQRQLGTGPLGTGSEENFKIPSLTKEDV